METATEVFVLYRATNAIYNEMLIPHTYKMLAIFKEAPVNLIQIIHAIECANNVGERAFKLLTKENGTIEIRNEKNQALDYVLMPVAKIISDEEVEAEYDQM